MGIASNATDDRAGPAQTPEQAEPGSRLAHDLRGAARLVLAGVAVRVLFCGLAGRDVVAGVGQVADLAGILPLRTEHDASDTFTVIVGRSDPDG